MNLVERGNGAGAKRLDLLQSKRGRGIENGFDSHWLVLDHCVVVAHGRGVRSGLSVGLVGDWESVGEGWGVVGDDDDDGGDDVDDVVVDGVALIGSKKMVTGRWTIFNVFARGAGLRRTVNEPGVSSALWGPVGVNKE